MSRVPGIVIAWLLNWHFGHFLRQRQRAVEREIGLPPGTFNFYIGDQTALSILRLTARRLWRLRT